MEDDLLRRQDLQCGHQRSAALELSRQCSAATACRTSSLVCSEGSAAVVRCICTNVFKFSGHLCHMHLHNMPLIQQHPCTFYSLTVVSVDIYNTASAAEAAHARRGLCRCCDIARQASTPARAESTLTCQ